MTKIESFLVVVGIHLHAIFRIMASIHFPWNRRKPRFHQVFLTTREPKLGQYLPKSTYFWKWSGYISMPHFTPYLPCVLLGMPRNPKYGRTGGRTDRRMLTNAMSPSDFVDGDKNDEWKEQKKSDLWPHTTHRMQVGQPFHQTHLHNLRSDYTHVLHSQWYRLCREIRLQEITSLPLHYVHVLVVLCFKFVVFSAFRGVMWYICP